MNHDDVLLQKYRLVLKLFCEMWRHKHQLYTVFTWANKQTNIQMNKWIKRSVLFKANLGLRVSLKRFLDSHLSPKKKKKTWKFWNSSRFTNFSISMKKKKKKRLNNCHCHWIKSSALFSGDSDLFKRHNEMQLTFSFRLTFSTSFLAAVYGSKSGGIKRGMSKWSKFRAKKAKLFSSVWSLGDRQLQMWPWCSIRKPAVSRKDL